MNEEVEYTKYRFVEDETLRQKRAESFDKYFGDTSKMSEYELAVKIIQLANKAFPRIYNEVLSKFEHFETIKIMGCCKEDAPRIVDKIVEYRAKGENPCVKINDAVRMSIKVPTPEAAKEIAFIIQTQMLRGKHVIKTDSKLCNAKLRNITIHGFNFNNGDATLSENFESYLGAEIQIQVGKEAGWGEIE